MYRHAQVWLQLMLLCSKSPLASYTSSGSTPDPIYYIYPSPPELVVSRIRLIRSVYLISMMHYSSIVIAILFAQNLEHPYLPYWVGAFKNL
jgi:hypothetical protein